MANKWSTLRSVKDIRSVGQLASWTDRQTDRYADRQTGG